MGFSSLYGYSQKWLPSGLPERFNLPKNDGNRKPHAFKDSESFVGVFSPLSCGHGDAGADVTPFLSLTFLNITPSLMLSGVIISNIAFFASAYFFYKLTQKLFNPRLALISTAFYCFWVGGVFFSLIYTEALFMALALGAFYYLEENKIPVAVFIGFLGGFHKKRRLFDFHTFFHLWTATIKNTETAVFQASFFFRGCGFPLFAL